MQKLHKDLGLDIKICYYLCPSIGKPMFMLFIPPAEGSGLENPSLQ